MKILLTADWHIRGDRPRCRIDEDWIESQRQDIQAVVDIARREKVDEAWVLGDLFHQPRAATEAVNMVLVGLKDLREVCPVYILPGNHDLPYHDYGNLEQSSLGIVLKSFPELQTREEPRGLTLAAAPFGLDPVDPHADVWATHQLTFENDETKPPMAGGKIAQDLLDEAPGVHIVVTGDYHRGYVYTGADGRRVITPGCLNIQAADMVDYKPRVYIWDTVTAQVTPHYLPINSVAIVTDYLAAEKARDERMDRCLEVATAAASVTLSFTDNLKAAAEGPGVSPGVKGIINEILDHLNKDRR